MLSPRVMNFMRICSRCHNPREAFRSRVIKGKFICAHCLREIRSKEMRHAVES